MCDIIAASVILFLGYWGFSSHKVKVASWIVFIISILYIGLSHIKAADTPTYIKFFQLEIPDLTVDREIPKKVANFEYGFIVLMTIFKTLFKEYFVFQFSLYFIELLLVIKGIQKLFDEKIVLGVVVSLFFVLPTILLWPLRQGIVLAAFIYCMPFILRRDIINYMVIMSVASLFHNSGFLLLPFYFLSYIRLGNDNRTRLFLILLLLVADFCYFSHFNINNLLFNSLSIFKNIDGLSKFAESKELVNNNDFGYGVFKVLEMNVFYIISLISLPKLDKKGVFLFLLFVCYLISAFLIGGILSYRLNFFFMIPYYILLIYSFNSFNYSFINLILILTIYLFILQIFKFDNILDLSYTGYRNLLVEYIFSIQS